MAEKLQNIFAWKRKQVKANKYSIFLVHTFKIVSPINLPKFASTQFFLKFRHF